MLKLSQISKSFHQKPILRQISLEIPTGQTHILLGSSGSGKTTLLRIILGLIQPDTGNIEVSAQDLQSQSDWARHFGYLPQNGGLFPHLTAGENIALPARARGWKQSEIDARQEVLCQTMALNPALLSRYPHELSGGQKQRVSLVRAELLSPLVLLLDEPLAALDPIIRHDIQGELRGLFQKLNKTVLIVTHDLAEAAYLGDQITLLKGGEIIQTGTFRELSDSPAHPFVTEFINAQRLIPKDET